jgi:signal peptidase
LRRAAGGVLALLVLAFVLPPAFGLSHSTVTDDAMSGTMERGSVVFAKPRPVADLEVGDVITYPNPSKPGELVTRRIAAIDAGVIWTSGDSTGALDPWTYPLDEATQALAVMDIPYAGYAYGALSGGTNRVWQVLAELY